ncbi:MAG: SET domain-containing protein-lysine N-methyltransferase [Chitinophagaceae bacterium]
MKVCVLQPDYSPSGVDYQYYDPERELASLIPEHEVHNVKLNKLTTFRQLKELSKQGFDVFVNLCEGYPEWEVPGVDVCFCLEQLNLPFTGPTTKLYDVPKELMKYVAFCEGVTTPGFVLIKEMKDLDDAEKNLKFPLFVKPAHAGDSLGVDENSLVHNKEELKKKVESIFKEFAPLLIEEYIAGREFTTLVAGNPDGHSCTVCHPVEYIFPEGKEFKTYSLKTSELHPDCNVPCNDAKIENQIRVIAEKMFKAVNAVGYGRLDFRVTDKKKVYFLEMNLTCSVFYKDGYEGSADFVLKYDGIGQAGFLRHIIAEGIARHQRKKKTFEMKGNSISGYGIYATRDIGVGEIVFKGEGKSQRIITKRFVEKNWIEKEKENFRRYAYPVSQELFILWDDDPSEWAPQNHCCDPNTAYDGLNEIAIKNISKGEELTLDYADFLDENMEPFQCHCRSSVCRGLVMGVRNNSLTGREIEIKTLLPG